MAAPPPTARPGHRLIFVVGARRSGTNWVGRIIGAHPDVAALPNETYLFHSLAELTDRFQHGSKGSWQLATLYVERDTLIDALRRFCDSVLSSHLEAAPRPGGRLLERTPDHVRNLRLIGEIYPGAHVVHIVRDARDVARSLVSMSWGPADLATAAAEWATAVEAAHAARPLLDAYHEIAYEQLFAHPRKEVADLYRSLGLRVDDALLDAALIEAEVPYNHDPSMPAIAVGKWRGSLTVDEVASIEAIAGEALVAAGYDLASDGPATARRPRRSARSLARKARGRVRARIRRRGEPAQADRSALQETQRVVDAFLGAVRSGDAGAAVELLDDRAFVRVLRGGQSWEGRGGDAPARFVAELVADPALTGPQLHSDVHPSAHAFTVVIAAAGAGGAVRHCTLVLYLDSGRVSRAAWYSPTGATPG